jgi:hypothetical protein
MIGLLATSKALLQNKARKNLNKSINEQVTSLKHLGHALFHHRLANSGDEFYTFAPAWGFTAGFGRRGGGSNLPN